VFYDSKRYLENQKILRKFGRIYFVIKVGRAIISPMKKTGFVWKIYLCAFTLYVLGNAGDILMPTSFLYIYYHILIAFHLVYIISYMLALGQVFFNLVSLIPLFLFVFRMPFLSPRFWQWMLVLRITFDLTGHAGEVNHLISISYANREWFISRIVLTGIMIIPSYGACFQYAFRWKEFWASQASKNFALTK